MDKWRAAGCGCAFLSACIVAALAGVFVKAIVDALHFDE
jgi:hypothetical protein